MAADAARAADLIPYKAPPSVAALPAVSAINGKIDGFGGAAPNDPLWGGRGSLTFPVGAQYGFQIDGLAASSDSRFLGAVGAHGFWRDPARGLLGLYVAHQYFDRLGGVNATRVAAEGEYYFAKWTLQGIAGIEFGNRRSTINPALGGNIIQTLDVRTRFFDKIDLAYYPTDNIKLSVGHRFVFGRHAAAFGGEMALPASIGWAASLFAEGRAGERDYYGAFGGLRVYFAAAPKTLIRRHREDDPVNWTPDVVPSTRTFVPNTAPPPPPPQLGPALDR
jgi:hypothetical protein